MSSTAREPSRLLRFPKGFFFGAATAAYQIEGAVEEDGRGPSCWDVFVRRPGVVHHGDTGERACDAYHRLEEDLDLIAGLGLEAYRFSVSWSRVLPDGVGEVNRAGLTYYERLVEGLVDRGVAPVLTCFHWDLPQALQDRGGWANRACANWFADYCALLGEVLGDRVAHWITHNEPAIVASHGYRDGTHAPGIADPNKARATTHHLLFGHGLAVAALRHSAGEASSIGIVLDPLHTIPLDAADAALAAEIAAGKTELYLSPLLGEGYPRLARDELVPKAELIHEGDLETIAAPIDFLGINYYDPLFVRRRGAQLGRGELELPGYPEAVAVHPDGYEVTSMGWIVDASSLRALLATIAERAPNLAILITENGRANHDYVDPNAAVHDPERIAYLRDHLVSLHQAIADGVDVRGYFVWSLLDNFEWAEGYSQRFGLIYVDYPTGRRTPKQSAAFYRQVIADHGIEAEAPYGTLLGARGIQGTQ